MARNTVSASGTPLVSGSAGFRHVELLVRGIDLTGCLGALAPGENDFVTRCYIIQAKFVNGRINYQLDHIENVLVYFSYFSRGLKKVVSCNPTLTSFYSKDPYPKVFSAFPTPNQRKTYIKHTFLTNKIMQKSFLPSYPNFFQTVTGNKQYFFLGLILSLSAPRCISEHIFKKRKYLINIF